MNFKKTKYSCYFSYLSMSSIFCMPPLLFITFHEMYGISYTLLGTLVLVNFCTQLLIDLIFSAFSKHFDLKKVIRIMPLLTSLGLIIYAIIPNFLPNYAYIGLIIGTVIFSVSAGMCEVLLSPLIAALPSDTPDRDMSRLHSLYAYGVLMVVLVSTLFLSLFGQKNWMYLALFWALLPLISHVLFCRSPMPDMKTSQNTSAQWDKSKIIGLSLFVACIFFGSSAENAMSNWASSFMENALGITKALGDILGVAMFAVFLGLGRSLYAKYGKSISKIMFVGMSGAIVCYLVAGFSSNVVVSVIACALTGLCTSMLWPGTLIMMEEKLPKVGVVAYALLAVGGDFGGSIAPQLLGIVVDKVATSDYAVELCTKLALSPEQLGLKVGMLVAALFPLLGVVILIIISRFFSVHKFEKPIINELK